MTRTLIVIGAILVASLVLDPVAADHGGHGDCSGAVIQIGLGDATPLATIYYVITGDTPDEGWGYLEANDVAGLQRGGISHEFFTPDNCQSTEYPDARWY